ncbi:MAG: hypothetical protein IT213_01560 [Cytophagales bacterium]|nr:hypothetical protein [Cytophagales bacterium]
MPSLNNLNTRITLTAELLPIVVTSLLPLFFDLSYQINLYMIWEGAYRLSLHQLPYKDFGIPMGIYGWVMPALFFKMFGASLFTLAKTQAFMNIVSGLSFRWILINVGASAPVRFLCIVIFSLTYILGLYWPQYNHTVIIFQLVGFGFLFQYFASPAGKWSLVNILMCSVFLTFSFFTKQDAGALAILIALVLVAYYSFRVKTIKPAIWIIGFLIVLFLLNILPFLRHEFGYWFNYGQAPHYGRISLYDIIRINMEESRWEKIYTLLVLGIYLYRKKYIGTTQMEDLFTLFVLGILAQAMIFQVTSYVPRDNNIFFHAFGCAYVLLSLFRLPNITSWATVTILLVMIGIWWSEKYWKYADKVVARVLTPAINKDVVSINTYILEPPECNFFANVAQWQLSTTESFKHVRMPASTVKGIDKIIETVKTIKAEKPPVVLNMSELTPLAKEAGYTLAQGPLWYHLGVGLFDRELTSILTSINSNHYDVVIFENIPTLNNFYPFEVREALLKQYSLAYTFDAPRIVYPGTIEVYLPVK